MVTRQDVSRETVKRGRGLLNADRCNGNVISICQASLEPAAKLNMVNAGKHYRDIHVDP